MPKSIIVVDLLFGDCGKGTITDALVRKHNSKLVVRYNGGCQSSHNVVTNEGIHHTFSQLGAGMFSPEVITFLGPEMIVEPLGLKIEADIFSKKINDSVMNRVFIASDASVTTPFHIALNRVRETIRGEARHGSVGRGVGETMRSDYLYNVEGRILYSQLATDPKLKDKLSRLRDLLAYDAIELVTSNEYDAEIATHMEWFKWDIDDLVSQYREIANVVKTLSMSEMQNRIEDQENPTIFEGSQGVLLDECHGFAPFNTWTDITTTPAQLLIRNNSDVKTIGVIRALPTRHGPGPFPTESMGLTQRFQDPYNPTNEWQREFRVGHTDLPLLRYGLACATGNFPAVDELAVTHLDYIEALAKDQDTIKVAARYTLDGKDYKPKKFDDAIAFAWNPPTQEQLDQTENMSLANPVYIDVKPHDFLDLITAATGLPISITSSGPKPKDKIFISH